MSSDRTQHQSTDELNRARDLSLGPARPPAKIPGYDLQKFLGSGAYGEVWSAIDHKTGRRVAIKFYTRRSTDDVQQLATEVQKLVVLAADRYVVQLLDVGWDAQPPYYVMDLIESGSLEDRLKSGKPLPTAEAIELFREVATGMMHLHGKGILHCDLKPGNVLLDQDGKPRVADFGQSRLSTDETPALGTLFYMAPEQADLEAMPDAKWDVYGLGALLFSMLTGKPPYYTPGLTNKIESSVDMHERLSEYRQAIRTAPAPTEHRGVPGVDRMLADIIDRCIAANPANRFDSIQSVLLALRQREMTRARRPLMLLGWLGPLLLTGVFTAFGWWAFNEAVARTDKAITDQAVESNRFAAKLAARSAAEQIDEYFQSVIELTQEKEFLDTFDDYLADETAQSLAREIAYPQLNTDNSLPARQQLINAKSRRALQPFLWRRLSNTTGKYPLAASWVVLDRFGNQVASEFRGVNNTLGRNYAYRTYFTGLDHDLKKTPASGETEFSVAERPEDRQMIDRPHLSSVFSSKQSNTWKIAFSAPIIRDGDVRGVAMVTVELGSFVDFDNEKTQYAMLVDARPGDTTGAILEHPLFSTFVRRNERIPDSLTRQRVDCEQVTLSAQFIDPLGGTPEGKEADYDQPALAAQAQVTVNSQLLKKPGNSAAKRAERGSAEIGLVPEQRDDTGLCVLAVEDKERVIEPAHELGRTLGRLSLLALSFLTLVALGMWLLVNRMLRESRERMAKAFSPSAMTGGFESAQDLPTVAAPHDSSATSAQ